jgi:tetratricopeptide (TPR) repeat protein
MFLTIENYCSWWRETGLRDSRPPVILKGLIIMRLTVIVLATLFCAISAGAQTEKPERLSAPASPKTKKETKLETNTGAIPQNDAQTAIQKASAYREFLRAQQFETEGNYVEAVESYKKVIELDPGSSEPRVSLGELYLRNRNISDAEAKAREAIKLNNDSIGAHRLLGRILASEGLSTGSKDKLQESIVQFLEVTRIDKQDPEAWKLLGALYSASNDSDKAINAYQNLISTGFASFQDYYELASLFHDKRRYRDAAQAARQAFEQSDNNPRARLMLADSLLRSGQTVEAIELFKDALKEAPNNPPGLILALGEALMYAGRYDESTQYLLKVIADNPKNLRALSLLSQVQRRAGKREEAAKTLKQALQGQDVTESLELQFELAEVYEEMGQIDNAISAYEEALTALLNPDGTVSESNKRNAGAVLQAIALAYRNGTRREKAFETFERMRKVLGSDSTLPDILTIDTLRTEGKYKEAVEAARGAQSRFPKENQFKFMEAESLSKLQRPDEALTILKTMLNGSQEDGDVYNYAAFIMLDNNRLDEAERQIRKAIQYDEKNISYLVTLSSIQDRSKNYKESEETLRRVLAINPDNSTALNNLGYFLTERNERLEEALELIQRAINIDPSNGSFLDSLGWVYFKLGKLELAQKYLEQAVNYDKRSATVREHLGDVYQHLGRTEDARKQWQTAMELTNDPEEVTRLKDKIKDPKIAQAKH